MLPEQEQRLLEGLQRTSLVLKTLGTLIALLKEEFDAVHKDIVNKERGDAE